MALVRRQSLGHCVAAVLALGVSGCVTARVATPSRVGSLPAHVEPDLVIVSHRVEKGQTVYRVAKAYGLTVEELMEANQLEDPRELKVGETLLIPGALAPKALADFDADEPEPAPRKSSVPGSPSSGPEGPSQAGKRAPTGPVRVGRAGGTLEWPLRGVLYAKFGRKGNDPHDGIDLSAPAGTPVKAAAAGTVLYAGEQKGYGLIVIVEHLNELITLYAHNRDLRVKSGQTVRQGQVVATVGDSGRTSGPHLHFEVRRDGVPVDPLEWLGPVPAASR
jgi:lipoprotein NlpD